MNTKTAVIGFVAASITAASAASITVDTVGVINPNTKTPISEATGNSLNVTTFASNIAAAFSNNTGGVWNFDGAYFDVAVGETITLKYGNSLATSLILTLGGTSGINQGFATGEPTSGTETVLGLSGDASTRTFTPSTPLLTIGIFNTDRNDNGRFPVVTVTYQDTTTASTSGANADDIFFHGLSGTVANPIVSFSLSQNAFVRYDDLGFIAVPEVRTATVAALGLLLGLSTRRRRA